MRKKYGTVGRLTMAAHILAICVVAALVIVGIAGSAGATPYAYISNERSNNVSVIDTATNTVTASVNVGSGPFGVAVNPAGTKVYVTNEASTNVSVIDTATNTVTASVNVGSGPFGVAVNPAGTKVYVTNAGSNTVSVIDTATNTVTASVNVGISPGGVAVNPAGTKVYVANAGSNTVSVIDTATNTVTATVNVGSESRGVAVNPAGTKVYVANYYSNTVSVIDTATNIVTATVNVGSNPAAFGQFIVGPTSTPPPTTGIITVTTNLAGATFSLTGASTYSGTGTSWSNTNAPAGTYTITYGTVAGNNAPPSETKTLTAGGSIAFSGTYTPTPTVTVTPTVTSTTVPPTPTVKQPSLTASHTTLKEEPEVGEEVLITVTVQNNGEGMAKNIRLTEQLPSSITVSYIDGATSNTPNLVTWNGELAPNRAHAIVHTLKIVEKKNRAIPVIIRYEDEAGNPKESSTTIYVSAQVPVTPTPLQTKAPEVTSGETTVKIPGFTALLVLVGLVAVLLLVRRR